MRLIAILKIMAVATVPIFISCNTKTRFKQDSLTENIPIPNILKERKDIEAFINETASQIHHLSIQYQQLIDDYRNLPDKIDGKNGPMADVKKVTVKSRINIVFSELSEIYNNVDKKTIDLENQLNAEQKSAFKLISNQLKDRIDDVMISFNPVEEKRKRIEYNFLKIKKSTL